MTPPTIAPTFVLLFVIDPCANADGVVVSVLELPRAVEVSLKTENDGEAVILIPTGTGTGVEVVLGSEISVCDGSSGRVVVSVKISEGCEIEDSAKGNELLVHAGSPSMGQPNLPRGLESGWCGGMRHCGR